MTRLLPLGGFVDLEVRFGTEVRPARQPNRSCSRERTSSQGIADSGSRSCASSRRAISARCVSVNGKAAGSTAMLSQRSSASWIRSATFNLNSSSREGLAMLEGYWSTASTSTGTVRLRGVADLHKEPGLPWSAVVLVGLCDHVAKKVRERWRGKCSTGLSLTSKRY